jgi:hypothetical protein
LQVVDWPEIAEQVPSLPQIPVQHWSSLEQLWPTSEQLTAEHAPLMQLLEQQSGPLLQVSWGPLQ